MKSTYRIDLARIKQKGLKEVFAILEQHLNILGIDFYLIGAVAKDVWLAGIHELALERMTRDVDLAILINDLHDFADLKRQLIETTRFIELKNSSNTLLFDEKIQVDLLPFGILNIDEISLQENAAFCSVTNGFAEVHQYGTEKVKMGKQLFKVTTLPGIVLLKLIAYSDRPEMRHKDMWDIKSIITHYDKIIGEELFEEEYNDLLSLDNNLKMSAQLIGRQIGLILIQSEPLAQRVKGILNKYTLFLDDGSGNEHIDLLKELLKGVSHTSSL